MALLTVAVAGRNPGVDIAGVAAAGGGDTFPNTGQEQFIIKNGDASSHTVTFGIQQTVDGQAVANAAQTINAGQTQILGPFPVGTYNDTQGLVHVTYSAVTSVTVKVVKCPPAT
jgi:uncharacterized Zn-binding protein involved in type VI secretion